MRVLYAYNFHRGGNGSLNATAATIRMAREKGLEVLEFTKDSNDLPETVWGRLTAAASAFYSPQALKEFEAALDSFRPDVVHTWDVFPLISPWIFSICAARGIPIVMTADDYFLTCPNRNHFREGKVCTECLGGHEYRALLHNCRQNAAESLILSAYTLMLRKLRIVTQNLTVLIVSSEFTRQWMSEHSGIPPERIDLVTHWVEIPATPADPGEGKYAAFAGRFVPEKGIETFLEAARISKLPFKLSRDKKFFVNVPLPPEAEVVVTSSRNEVHDFYRSARALVMPAIWFETFGLVGAESMAHGIPVIGANIGAVANLIEDGVDGLIFESGNAQDLAHKVRWLWDDPERSRRLGKNAREKAIRLWSAEKHIKGVIATYSRAIESVRMAKKR
jgi:glycosyltransferase involved in cell wall biosynthesis